MAPIPRKTYPELTALTAPVVDGDVLAAYRSPGPLRRLTASTFADYIKAFFSASGGSSLIGFLQSGTDATSETVQTTLRRIVVCPEQFSGTDTEKVQAAFDSAGDIPGQNVARIVRFSDFYDTTATINVPAYVMIEGVGAGRSGLRPTMSSGPALRASVANNTSSYLCEWKDFGIDGTSATGSAYALELVGQKITTLSRIRFSNFDTSSHAVDYQLGCQSILLDQCQFVNNRMNERIGVPYVGVSFPTTVTHKSCIYEEGPSTGAECVLLQDANGCSWIDRCVFQSIDTPVVFRVVSSANQQTAANHLWDSVYLEANGASHGSAYTWSFEGDSTSDRILGCSIINSDIHGAAPGGGHVYAENTDLLFAPLGQNASGHTWYVDGGGNTRFNYVWANQYQLAALTFADIDGSNFRIWNGGAAISGYLSGSQNLWANTTHTFSSIGAGVTFAVINSTGIRSNGTYLIGANTVLDVDGTNHRLFAPDGDPVFYAGATENLHRNAVHRFSNQAVSVDYGIFSSVGLNLGAGLALQIGGTQVVGARGAAVADATDAASAITQLNALLARCRAHGLIAT